MRLGLSSAALADAHLDILADACAARGLTALELRSGDGHGIGLGADGAAAARAAETRGVTIAGYWTHVRADVRALAQLSCSLNAPVIVDGAAALSDRIERARNVMHAGGRALVAVRGPAGGWLPDMACTGIGYAWELGGDNDDVAGDVQRVLTEAPLGLRYIRLIGGGPETAMQGGRGIGALAGQLALAAYDGPLVLTPSSTRYRVAWASWLGRRGGWGCGSKAGGDVVALAVAQDAQ